MKESLKVTLTGNQETLLSTEIFLPTFYNGVYSIKKILKKTIENVTYPPQWQMCAF